MTHVSACAFSDAWRADNSCCNARKGTCPRNPSPVSKLLWDPLVLHLCRLPVGVQAHSAGCPFDLEIQRHGLGAAAAAVVFVAVAAMLAAVDIVIVTGAAVVGDVTVLAVATDAARMRSSQARLAADGRRYSADCHWALARGWERQVKLKAGCSTDNSAMWRSGGTTTGGHSWWAIGTFVPLVGDYAVQNGESQCDSGGRSWSGRCMRRWFEIVVGSNRWETYRDSRETIEAEGCERTDGWWTAGAMAELSDMVERLGAWRWTYRVSVDLVDSKGTGRTSRAR